MRQSVHRLGRGDEHRSSCRDRPLRRGWSVSPLTSNALASCQPHRTLIESIERSTLRGKGGAGFPVATKWRSVASQRSGTPIVLANGGEGEPLSRKDRMLMEQRPHLVIDGAMLAAAAVGADDVVLYVGAEHAGAIQAMQRAIAERSGAARSMLRLVSAPVRYVSGEETAAVHFINDGIALPTSIPPRPYERGVDGRPTLVQNVETLAHVALIARFGDEWYRSLGFGTASGTTLVTVGGAVPQTVLIEIPQGMMLADAVNAAGGITSDSDAVLLGGYFGGWVESEKAWGLSLELRCAAQSRAIHLVAVSSPCFHPVAAGSSRQPESWRTSRTRALASAGRARSACAPSPHRQAALQA